MITDDGQQIPTKLGSELTEGDVYQSWHNREYRIVGFAPHPGLSRDGSHYTARVMLFDDPGCKGQTLFDCDVFRQSPAGTWIPAHLWFEIVKQRKYA